MAASVTIEIPVSVVDNTGGVLGQIQNKLTRLEQAAQKVSKIMMGGTAKESGIEKAMRKMDDTLNKKHSVEITAEDNATGVISDVEDALHRASGMSADIDIGANDMATDVINDAMDSVSQFSGTSGEADIEANDMASDIILAANNTLDSFNGNSGVADITANDMASDIIVSAISEVEAFNGEMGMATLEVNSQVADVVYSAMGAVAEFDGSHGTGYVEVEDTATDTTMNAIDAVQEFDGMHGTATLDIVDNATAAINQATSKVKGFAGSAMAATGAALGASVGFNDAVNTYRDYEYTMSGVLAISGANESEYQDLLNSAQYYGANTMFTATQVGEAFKYMGMAGWNANEMQAGIGGILNLAGASGEDLGTVSDIVTDALTAFGYKATDATHFSDVLAQAATSSNTNVGLMGETFKYVGTMAGTLGYTAEDTAIAIGAMANAGLKGSMAGTSLNSIMTRLATNTNGALDTVKNLGIEFFNADGSARPFLDVMTDMRDATKDFSAEGMTNFAKTVAGLEAQKGLSAILNLDDSEWNSLVSDIYSAEGAADRMVSIMMDNLQGDLFYFQSALDGVKLTLGQRVTPYLRDAIQSLTDVMPNASAAIDGFMDKVDKLTSSEAWSGADLAGKINLAWDTLIAEPFQEWAGSTGVDMISTAITGMFTSAGNVLSGNGQLTDWLGTAALVATVTKVVDTIGKIGGAVDGAVGAIGKLGGSFLSLPTSAGGVVAAGLLVAAGIAVIAAAVHDYNQLQIENNLAEHFGNLSLSAQQVSDLANSITQLGDATVKLDSSNLQFFEAATLQQEAEKKLAEINEIQWKVQKIGCDISSADLSALDSAATELHQKLTETLEAKRGGTEDFIKAIFPENQGQEIVDTINGWFSEDQLKLDNLQGAVKNLLQEAIDSGTESVETATAISMLQSKMMEIATGPQKAELQGKLDWLSLTSSGAALDSDSWKATVAEIGSIVNDFQNADATAYQSVLGSLNLLEWNDPSRHPIAEGIRSAIKEANNNKVATGTVTAWDWMYNGISDAYGSELEQARGIVNSGNYNVSDFTSGLSALDSAVNEFANSAPPGTQGALADRFQTMLPTVDALQRIIDNATEPIPQSVMQAYNQAMELGAYAGDASSQKQHWANMFASQFPGMEEMQSALADNGIDFSKISQDYQDAFTRAFTETKPDIDYKGVLDDIANELSKETIDWDKVNAKLQSVDIDPASLASATEQATQYIAEGLQSYSQSSGSQIEVTQEGIHVKFGEMDVDVDQLAEAVGMSVSELESAVGMSKAEIEAAAEVTIPADAVDVDTAQLASAIETVTADSTGTVHATADAEVGVENVDTSAVEETLEKEVEKIGSETEEVEKDVSLKITTSEVEASGAASEAESKTREQMPESVPAETTADITVNPGTVETPDVYEDAKTHVEDLFKEPIPVENATVKVTVTTPVQLEGQDGLFTDAKTQIDDLFTEPIPVDKASVQVTPQTPPTLEGGDGLVESVGTQVGELLKSVPADGTVAVTLTKESDNIGEIYTQCDTEIRQAFAQTFNPDGNVDVHLTQTNNRAAIYGEADGQIKSTFLQGFTASANVAVTLNWSITNPSASISTSSSGSSVHASIGASAEGRYVDNAMLSWIGEDGPEYVIPVGAKRHARGMDLWMQAGKALGVDLDAIPKFAEGGLVGATSAADASDWIGDQTWASQGDEATMKDDGSIPSIIENSKKNITVQVNVSPSFSMTDIDENDILSTIRFHMKEIADEVGAEIADTIGEAFENRPLAN